MFSSPYSPTHAVVGEVLIGISSLLVLLATGRQLGISGMFSRSLFTRSGDWTWRLVFFAGLLAVAALTFHTVDASALHRPVRSMSA